METGTVYWPIVLYACFVAALVAIMVGLSAVLGQRHRDPATGAVYEGGIPPSGSARLRVSVKFYLMAMFFVVFDLEIVFLVTWAVAAAELGWAGYWQALVFAGVLMASLVYLWRLGALDWAPPSRRTAAPEGGGGLAGRGGA
jgi:NADH-quinone oxidoreductase subunit A